VQSEVDQCCRRRGARNPWVVGSSPIPTWFYGHEPPDVFASAIAKYFSNALREDVVPRRAVDAHGVVYSRSVQSALGADIKSGATGSKFTGADGWDASGALPNGDGLGVAVYQYANGFQRRVLAALMHPSRNSIALG